LTARYNDKAVEFVRKHRDTPFFLYLAHNLPHIPLYAGKEHLGKSRRGLYGDVVGEIDAGVGKLMDTLRELGIAQNTLVVFSSDNGPWLPFATHGGSAGLLRNGKGTTFEGGMRVPGIFWWPGTFAPAVQMDIGATMDLLPTFCALAGTKPPADRKLDGHDLSDVLTGKSAKSPRQEVFYWRSSELYAVRSGPWKMHLIIDEAFAVGSKPRKPAPPELYHLDTDPSEKHDVARQHPDVVARLKQLAKEHVAGIEPAEDQMNRTIAKKK
jgi:arylsulfatase A-like enzyme